LAASIGDGLICTAPAADLVDRFERAGGAGPRLAEMLVCVDASEARAWKVALERWPLPGIPGELSSELPLPRHFEQAASVVDRGDLKGSIVVGPDPRRYVEAIARYRDAGFDHVFLHQVGHDQDGFFAFAAQELLPLVRRSLTAAA
jgi:hypothetical protein